MKRICKVCGKEYSVSKKNLPDDKELCSIRCEMKYNLRTSRAGVGKNDANMTSGGGAVRAGGNER